MFEKESFYYTKAEKLMRFLFYIKKVKVICVRLRLYVCSRKSTSYKEKLFSLCMNSLNEFV